MSRLETFVQPFTASLAEPEQRRHTVEYLTGLLSKLKHKTGEGIAYLHDQERQGLQKFIGQVPWERSAVARDAGTAGRRRPGRTRRRDRVRSLGLRQEGDQVGGRGAAVVRPARQDRELPGRRLHGIRLAQGTCDRQYASLSPRGVDEGPEAVQGGRGPQGGPSSAPATNWRWRCWRNTARCCRTPGWRATTRWAVPRSFRLELRGRGERYLLAVPSNTLVRDLDAPPPEYAGRGPHPQNPFVRVDRWCAALPESAWTTIEVRDGEKGPLVVEVVKCRVQARTPTGGTGPEEVLFITRERQADGTFKHDYYLSNADPEVPLEELARVAKAAHRIEECFKRAKGEAGLGDYQVRNWIAWHHHQTLALLAAWFLNQETRRGKNPDPGADVSATAATDRGSDRGAPQGQPTVECRSRRSTRWLERNEYARFYHHRSRNILPPLKNQLRL